MTPNRRHQMVSWVAGRMCGNGCCVIGFGLVRDRGTLLGNNWCLRGKLNGGSICTGLLPALRDNGVGGSLLGNGVVAIWILHVW